MKPRLLILSFVDIDGDPRVMKQVRRFVDDYLLTTCSPGPSPHPGVEHVQIRSDHLIHRTFPQRVRDVLARATERFGSVYFNSHGVLQTEEILRGRGFDAVIANDAETVGVACRIFGRDRVHADLHEFFPDMAFDDSRLGRRQQRYWTWMTHNLVSKAASSTTVGWEIARKYHEYGLHPDVVTNSTHFRPLVPRPVGSTVRMVHSGNPFRERSLDEIMNAVAATEADVSFDLYLTREPAAARAEFVALADALGDRITVHDPVPQSELIETLNEYDLGIHILQPESTNTRMALPNKFFDYVQARLGIIVGPSVEMVKIVEERGLGVVTDSFDAAAIRRAIDAITPEAVEAYKRNADLAAEVLSSERQVETWATAVAKIVASHADAR